MLVQMGIDWARHDAVVVLRCGERYSKLKMVRSTEGLIALFAAVEQLGGEGAECEASIEAGDVGLCGALHARGVRVFEHDAKQAKRFAESLCSSGAKNDARDADNLLRMLGSAEHRREPWRPAPEQSDVAAVLLDDHDDVERKIQRVVNQLRSALLQVHPALERALGNLRSRSAWSILEAAPTWQHGALLDQAERDELMAKCRFHAKTRQVVRAALAEPWLELPALLLEAHAGRVRRLVAELQELEEKAEQLDRALEQLQARAPTAQAAGATPGVGVVLALSLLALRADELAEQGREALAVRCGVAPVGVQSGKSSGIARMRKSAPVRGRRTAYLLAMQAIRRMAWAKAQYRHLRDRGKEHGTAARIVARSLLRLMSALLRSGEVYDEARYLESLRARGVEWACGLAASTGDDAPGDIGNQPGPRLDEVVKGAKRRSEPLMTSAGRGTRAPSVALPDLTIL